MIKARVTPQAARAKVRRNGDKFEIFESTGAKVGQAFIGTGNTKDEYVLLAIDIDKPYQRKGYGTRLLQGIGAFLRRKTAKILHSSNEGSGTVQILDKVFGRANVTHYGRGGEVSFEEAKEIMDVAFGYTRSEARFRVSN